MSYTTYNPKESEKEVLTFWEQSNILKKIEETNAKGKDFYFLQGPPYTSGKIHCGHAWNHALKDMLLRYKRMTGHNVLARAGYDMHGLPTELKVQKKFDLHSKEDIANFGHDKFVTECLNWSEEKAADMNVDLKNLGVTLDFSDPYKPITQDYIDAIW
ncbi:MAG: class I tRNA ligase family protein, partial [Candidatus Woesearchaeota archaeon]